MGKSRSTWHSHFANKCHSVTPWITNLGYQNCFISTAFVALAACSAVFVIIKYGKALRVRTASRYHKLVADDKRVMGVASLET
jgi:mannose/cellobiose epimerase-like protein (N-acyl-D-glucosamine 2-epimerase family)